MRKALLVEGPASSKSLARMLEQAPCEVERFSPKDISSITHRGINPTEEAFVVLNAPLSGATLRHALVELKRKAIPVLLTGTPNGWKKLEKQMHDFADDPNVDLLRTPVNATELRFRISRLTKGKPLAFWPALRSDGSGRIDANLVAEYLGWTLTRLSQALKSPVKTVHKTPDARSLQQRLEVFERIILLSQRLLTTDPVVFRKWLNTPSSDLDNARPGDVLLTKPDVVLGWLEDAALGHPS
jgi:hypothetical protein